MRLALLLLTGCATAESFATEKIADAPGGSVHRTTVTGDLKPHRHNAHDECVTILSGWGALRIGDATHDVKPGDFFVIPRGTIHEFHAAATVRSVFTPPFDGQDREFVEDP